MKISAVDLFCGAGGLTHGFLIEKLPVTAGIDVDPACRFPYEENNGAQFVKADIAEISSDEVDALYARNTDFKVLAGCAPCQPFSAYARGQVKKGDPRWSLLHSFARLIRDIRPDAVTMENVLHLQNHDVYKDFIHALEQSGYQVTVHKVYCPQYGVPQNRRRLVVFGSLHGTIPLPPPMFAAGSYPTVGHAIGHLEPIKAGSASVRDPVHFASNLTDINLRRIRASRPGGTWEDWSEDLRLACHKRITGTNYPHVYGRMEWDKPAPTITTQCNRLGDGRFGHPSQDRAISLREAALLQTFPEDYRFLKADEPINITSVARLIGNAVPVKLGRVIARSILAHLGETHAAI